ncbi:phage baseplate assembly protein V [Ornithinimicrobium cerasi]|uniref:Gp5/Type VI secretion system Vgr protein OB-fold domain-containing protein n=1 Tax=Ornithinimicrobium cerasi TaxID=2248773 RepID=A0A285VE62_9MICO|nr:phage baseplate assembly protein V [Ornithinimicrobium cerasi]SOC52257.1 hypothetical protein SAMN05421879_101466 [Ornithinimicrobium cerasi]
MTTPQGPLVGEVVGVTDPLQRGRLQVQFPQLGVSVWCTPAHATPQAGAARPGLGALVLVVWQNNDRDDEAYWIGAPPTGPEPEVEDQSQVLVRTPLGVEISLLVRGESVTLSSSAGPVVTLDGSAVTVANGKGAHVALDGPTVDVNHGALVVT